MTEVEAIREATTQALASELAAAWDAMSFWRGDATEYGAERYLVARGSADAVSTMAYRLSMDDEVFARAEEMATNLRLGEDDAA